MRIVRTLSLALFLAVVFCGALPAVAQSVVTVPAITNVAPGGDAVVPIAVDPADDVISMNFVIHYDPAVVTPTGVYKTAFTNDFIVLYNIPTAGDLYIVMYSATPLAGSGEVAWVVFRAIGAAGTSSPLTWTQHDLNEGDIPSTASDGQINIVAAQSTLSMPDDAAGANGSTVGVPVTATPADGYISADLDIRWNPLILSAQSVDLGDVPGDWSLQSNLSTPGQALVTVYGPTPLVGTHDLFKINYLVTGTAGDQTPLDIVTGFANEGNITTNLDDGLFTVNEDCDDGNPCTSEVFNGSTCVYTNVAAGTACGDPSSNPPCDAPDTCDGLGACQSNHASNGTACGDTGTDCTNQDTCFNGACQDNGFQPSTTHCTGASQGDTCDNDAADHCTGTDGSCVDVYQASGFTCRPSAGQCDVAEMCTGSSGACPADVFASSSTSCTGASQGDACDDDAADHCSGTANTCVDAYQSSSVTCRPSAGQCDAAEMCTGSSGACPADVFASSSTHCLGASQGDTCDDDAADHCSGTDATTCVDAYQSSGFTCRASAGQCDVAEMCTGSSGACPADVFASSSTHCLGASQGDTCDNDATDHCTGTDATTCVDAYQSSSFTCRPSAGQCDVAEMCTGSSGACPADVFASSATHCLGASQGGACDNDPTDHCTGTSATTCVDLYQSSSFTCRPAAGQCDAAEMCTGSSGACPADVFLPNGTGCNDANPCTSFDQCTNGTCAGTPNPPPAEVNDTLLVGQSGPSTLISWTDSPGPFNVYRGTRRSGIPWAYNQGCLAQNVGSQSAVDILSPDPGVTFFYLVTRTDGCSESIPGRDSDGNPIPNNSACPTSGNDGDSDGHIDKFDNCPTVPNPTQTDTDNDTHGDACDNCPANFNPNQSDIDHDGLGDVCDPDMDNDGRLNGMDNCPRKFNPLQQDGDGDGVGDTCDNCPTVMNADQHDYDNDGIGDACDPTPLPAPGQTTHVRETQATP